MPASSIPFDCSHFKQAIAEQEENSNKLLTENITSKGKVEQLLQSKQELLLEVATLRSLTTSQQASLQEELQQNQSYRNCTADLQTAQHKIGSLKQEQQALRNTICDLECANAQLTKRLQDSERFQSAMRNEISSYSQQVQSLQTKLDAEQKRTAALSRPQEVDSTASWKSKVMALRRELEQVKLERDQYARQCRR